MDNTTPPSLLSFPCDFLIKVMGKQTPTLVEEITCIVHNHYPSISSDQIHQRASRTGQYISLSITVPAESQAALDALYHELTAHPDVKMVL